MADEGDAPVDQTPEEVEVAERRLYEKLDREAELAQLRSVLTQEAARDVLWRVLEWCLVFGQTFDPNFGKMAFNEGRRSIGLTLLSEIGQADPEAMVKMQHRAAAIAREQQRRQEEAAARRRRRNP
jgi:hypothetical protein